MGQHKYNRNCQLAREGKLPPKSKELPRREKDRVLMKIIYERTGFGKIDRALSINSYE